MKIIYPLKKGDVIAFLMISHEMLPLQNAKTRLFYMIPIKNAINSPLFNRYSSFMSYILAESLKFMF